MKWLGACPDEVIRRFINRSFRFMDAYRSGRTGNAAFWAVRHQKSHRQASEGAMAALEAGMEYFSLYLCTKKIC